ncbi:2827_t:CDS:2 [Cetraspora pellucida]|uniref:2827_t:CDS:1 n=1 Tax=Cetraspora pellucida TaxID=1433469 RepID=A0A9N9C8V9_9GLOM|nr:2827_t:CDS:2 [Cetraspora pellucida]
MLMRWKTMPSTKKIERKTYCPNRSLLKTPIKNHISKPCQKRSPPTTNSTRTYKIKEGIIFNYSWTEPVREEGRQKGSETGRIRKGKSKSVSNLSEDKKIKTPFKITEGKFEPDHDEAENGETNEKNERTKIEKDTGQEAMNNPPSKLERFEAANDRLLYGLELPNL